jgi:hypothetical protein
VQAKGDSGKKQRKDLLALLFTWGMPSSKQPAGEGGAAAGEGGGGAAGEPYDWQGWGGRGDVVAGSLAGASDKELTALLKVSWRGGRRGARVSQGGGLAWVEWRAGGWGA